MKGLHYVVEYLKKNSCSRACVLVLERGTDKEVWGWGGVGGN